MSERGGDARLLTTPDSSKAELGHWWPQLLPDGDHAIFTAYRTPPETSTIEVLSIRTGARRVLLTGGMYGFYVPTGHLLYGATTLQLSGSAVAAMAIFAASPGRKGRSPIPPRTPYGARARRARSRRS